MSAIIVYYMRGISSTFQIRKLRFREANLPKVMHLNLDTDYEPISISNPDDQNHSSVLYYMLFNYSSQIKKTISGTKPPPKPIPKQQKKI